MSDQWQDLTRPPLRALALRQALTTGPRQFWRTLDVVAETGSTNADLSERARAGEPEGTVLVADHQTAGRGRRDRTWTAPPRSGLAVSVLLRPSEHFVPQDRWSWLTLMAGVAVTDALIRVCGLPATLKWPNDVLVPVPGADEPGKVAGLLAEVVRSDAGTPPAAGTWPGAETDAELAGFAVVIGLGINVSQDVDELPVPTATSLKLAGSAVTDRDTVLRAVLRALAERYQDFITTAPERSPEQAAGQAEEQAKGQDAERHSAAWPAGLAAVYRERCSTIGRSVRAHLPDGTTLDELADGVDDEGRLLLREQPERPGSRVHALSAGDVVHIRPSEPA